MRKRIVLVVDDQVINRQILGKILKDQYEVLYAENGKIAMDILHEKAEVISAVVLDIVMPEMDGYEVLSEMAKDSILSKIPVIVSSQQDGDAAEVHALSLGAQDFIAKPYKADIICHRLENTIRLRETASLINKVEKDELTGLYNKQFFMDKVQRCLQAHADEKFELICVGIERFKLINDTFGIQKGDEVLKHMAKILKEAETSINIWGRFAADEFYVLAPYREHYNQAEMNRLYQRMQEVHIDMDIRLNCGIYQITDNTIPVAAMCERALLAAKRNKGKYDQMVSYYDDSIREKILKEQFITSNMQTALETEQFQVYYQPKYDLQTESVAGAEALVRWIHPEKGFMSPGEFIPLFEKNGFITKLDCYVWEKVCEHLREWMDLGNSPIAISVNVSRADLYNPNLIDILLGLLEKYKIPIRYLHLEITESAYTNNPEQIIDVVNHLRELGFAIEMDDFGSGYSSLNMLAEMPVDVLKLDMKFIQNETKKTVGKGILSFVISMAKWLNLAVVAEGVETKEQITTLCSMDCNYVQGFYYAKPMPKESFFTLLQNVPITDMVCTSKSSKKYGNEKLENTLVTNDRQMLIVDDIDINREILAEIFGNEYVIVEKENGKEAWEYLQENYDKVEVVMLDLLMPIMDGFQLLDKIRTDSKKKDMPVIITSQGDENSEQRALEMNANDFIAKPYKPELIKHRVYNVVAGYQLKHMKAHQGKNEI